MISPSNAPGDTWLWNWQWSCGAEQAPPAPSCIGCNIAISIRILSPGDDGDLTQSILNTAESIASTVNDTVQQATQAVVQPPAVAPALATTPPALPALFQQVPLGSMTGLMTAIVLPTALLPVEPELSITLLGDTERGDTGVIPAARSHKPRRQAVSPALSPAPAAVVFAPLTPVRAALPAAAQGTAQGTAPPLARPTERRRSHHGPLRLPQEPLAPPAQLSVAPATSGTGSAGGVGLAILVGALLAASPQTARWLRTVRTGRQRAPVSRRPERPG